MAQRTKVLPENYATRKNDTKIKKTGNSNQITTTTTTVSTTTTATTTNTIASTTTTTATTTAGVKPVLSGKDFYLLTPTKRARKVTQIFGANQ